MPDFMQLAKDGNIGAIEVLMNKSFGSQGVVVRVDKSDSTLKITLKSPSDSGPDQKLAERVKAGLGKVKPKGFAGAVIEGRTIKSDKLVWSTQWGVIHAASKPKPVASSPPKATVSVGGKSSKEAFKKKVVVALLGIIAGLVGYIAWAMYGQAFKAALTPLSSPEPVEVAESKAESRSEPPVETTPPPDYSYKDAIDQALDAVDKSQTASTSAEWRNAAAAWDEATVLMKRVPESNENYAEAQGKISEYQRNLEYAQSQAIATLPTIGASKAAVQAVFSQPDVDFSFENSPLTDGTPRLLGTAPGNLAMIELYGLEDKLTKAVMMTFIGRGISPELMAAYNVAFLTEVAPGYDWDSEIADSVDDLSSGRSEEVRKRAGSNIVSMTLTETLGVFMFIVSVEPGQAG